MLSWGIIGAGRIARKFATALRESQECQLVAVASREQARAVAIAAELGAPTAYGSYAALLADPQLDAIYIALPNSMHAEWAINAAQAGKHILCEKPLAPTIAEAEAMFNAARTHRVWLMEAFMYRFHPRTLALQDLILSGAIGQVRLIRAGFSFSLDRPNDVRWSSDLAGGALYDVGCYPLNLARTLIGSPPQRVWATAQWSESGVDQTLAATLEYPGDAIVQIACSFRASFQQQVQIVGSAGVIELDQAFTMHPDQETQIRLWRGNHFAQLELLEFAATNHYRLEADGFARLIQAGHGTTGLPEMPLLETLDNLTTIEALLTSARTNQPVSF
jgi:D-xylose 1-dehydrogenase (NADP+, D-xylono-1,5-lactone-forming)